jgi:hypothetical protein
MRTIGTDGANTIEPERMILAAMIDGELWAFEIIEGMRGSAIDFGSNRVSMAPLCIISPIIDQIRKRTSFLRREKTGRARIHLGR